MKRTLVSLGIAAIVSLGAAVAVAEDAPEEPGTLYGISAGAVAVGLAPEYTHIGTYGIAGVNAAIPAGPVTVIPAVSLEYSNALGAWGGVLTCTVDKALPGLPVGLDVTGIVLSDQVGSDFANTALYGGAGAGLTWLINEHWSASAAWNGYHGLNAAAPPGWTQGPIAFVAYTF